MFVFDKTQGNKLVQFRKLVHIYIIFNAGMLLGMLLGMFVLLQLSVRLKGWGLETTERLTDWTWQVLKSACHLSVCTNNKVFV